MDGARSRQLPAMLALSLLVAYVSARPWIAINPMEAVRHA